MPFDIWTAVSLVAVGFGLFTSILYILLLFEKTPKYQPLTEYPFISVIVPVWNEGSKNGERMRKTIDSVLNSDYPNDKYEVIVVNDGSTDNSLEIAKSYEKDGVVVLSHEKSKGKTLAVNEGIKISKGELVVALDADSFVMPDVFKKLTPVFQNDRVMAAIPSVKVWKPKGILQYIQFQEFLGATFIRHLQAKLGAIPLAPGAFTLIRKSFIEKHGLLNHKTMVEDLEMSLRIQSEDYLIENVIDANVYTSGVKTVRAFISQRLRWFCGFIIQIRNYKHLFSFKYGNLGIFILPISVIFILLNISLFVLGISLTVKHGIIFVRDLAISGVYIPKLSDFYFDTFFIPVDVKTVLPLILLLISFAFTLYMKFESKEKEKVLKPFICFVLTYWFLGSVCWILAGYYYITKKKIRWGPNYFTG